MPVFTALKALQQLGPRQVGWYAWYQFLLRLGIIRRMTGRGAQEMAGAIHPILKLPDAAALRALLGPQGRSVLLFEADQIAQGRVRLFGGEPAAINLTPPGVRQHWIQAERAASSNADLKDTWEPARFGWAFTLGRAYLAANEGCAGESYAEAFWRFAEIFWQANPVNAGPNWASAQEVALRLMAFTFAAQVFASSPHSTAARLSRLAQSIAEHAARIPPTLAYALAQNNNHLLSEAAGLITAGLALREHPQAAGWLALGRRRFAWALQHQIDPDGVYCQHSANYHRLMLQLALWVQAIDAGSEMQKTLASLQMATRWLLALVDPLSGGAPNLGPNDGAYIFPLTVCPFNDYRPALQAAAQSFLGASPFGSGPWDEMALWLGRGSDFSRFGRADETTKVFTTMGSSPIVLRSAQSWAYLRAARFTSRPGHADQLHLDLWWRGLNVAQDAGTYRYSAPSPWENALAGVQVHNTVSVNGQDQMTRAGKFLWLDWAQASLRTAPPPADLPAFASLTAAASHNGYRRLGLIHQRTVTVDAPDHWLVHDDLLATGHAARRGLKPGARRIRNGRKDVYRLHWLLPDWPWEVNASQAGFALCLSSPEGWIMLNISAPPGFPRPALHLIRAGALVYGEGQVLPIQGWTSPTYGHKIPALALVAEMNAVEAVVQGTPPRLASFVSEWDFSGAGLLDRGNHDA